jgi:cardiolipin synthase A/B
MPGIGVIFYLLLSGHFFTGTRRMKNTTNFVHELQEPFLYEQKLFLEQHRIKLPNHVIKEQFPLIMMNLTRAGSELSYSNAPEVFTDGAAMFNRLYQDIENAQKSICLEYFIFKNDISGTKFMNLLCQKSREGVDIKLLYDDLGSLLTPTRFFRQLDAAGGCTHAFFQIRLGLPLTINFRNHRKIAVIDSKAAYLGGINIGDEYANTGKNHQLNWRDTAVRITGTSVFSLQSVFLIDWYSATAWKSRSHSIAEAGTYFPPNLFTEMREGFTKTQQEYFFNNLFMPGHIPTQIITSGPNGNQQSQIEDVLIRLITNAKHQILIQTPYFTPDEQFISALKIAAYSGVEIRIQIPRDWDKIYMKAASYQFVRELQGYGIRFYQYPGFIHAKTLTVDGKITSIGTANIDSRSFQLHFEVTALFFDETFSEEHTGIFFSDEDISHEVLYGEFDRKPLFVRAFWSFCKLFTPLL